MTVAEYLNQHEKMHGHFYYRHGRYLWDVMWSINVYGHKETLRVELHFNLSTRYLGGGVCRGRAPHEVTRPVQAQLDKIREGFDYWVEDGTLNMPAWAYADPTADTRMLFLESASS